MVKLSLELSEEVAKAAGLDGTGAPETARFLILLELYREGRLSLGRMAELAGFSQAELLDKMRAHATCLNTTTEDLDQDRLTLPS